MELFEKQIRPLLVENCYKCHSAQAEKLKGGLLLDTKEGVLKGGETGPAIVPGKPEESLLIKAVQYKDEKLQMPPKKKLSDKQIAALITWVGMGAPDPRVESAKSTSTPAPYDFEAARKQWAFRKPQEPAVPEARRAEWPRSALDHFILASLEKQNLQPAQAADKRALIRRATFDLWGIPPSPEDVAAFLGDESPDAFEKVVERLLASPLYGERWARHWLDVVRYTDSNDSRGIGGDADIPEAYRYRDWVVAAFNKDLPYDQFIIDQFAGDLLQPRDPEKIDSDRVIATGLLAIGEWGTGDADKDKMMTDIVDDQIDVTGRVFLGLTLACARCHDHKFDPITNEDYYSLAGIFFSSHILPRPGDKTAGSATLRIPLASKVELDRRKAREEKIKELQKEIDLIRDDRVKALATEALPFTSAYLDAAYQYKQDRRDISLNAQEHRLRPDLLKRWAEYLGFGDLPLLNNFSRDLAGKPGLFAWHGAGDTPSATINSNDKGVEFLTIKMPPKSVAVHPSPKAPVAVGFRAPISGEFTVDGKLVDADPNCGDGINWSIDLRRGSSVENVARGGFGNGGEQSFTKRNGADRLSRLRLSAGDLLQFAIDPKGDYGCDTTLIEVDIVEIGGEKRVWNLTRDLVSDPYENGQGNPHSDSHGHKGVWAFYDLAGQALFKDLPAESSLAKWLGAANAITSEETLAQLPSLGGRLQTNLLAIQAETKTPAPREAITRMADAKVFEELMNPRSGFWSALRENNSLLAADAREQFLRAQSELAQLKSNPPAPLPVTHGIQEGGVPESVHAGIHDAHIHIRGRYDRLGPVVSRKFPRVLAGDKQKPVTEGSGRLQLARWLASPDNPLTARVMVNRIWQHHFGEGIVRTPNNYGKLGEPPSHPELLDWLAHRFVESGWSIKAMHRLMMLSAAYQQSALGDLATMRADPENRLFGRMNRQRMEAETLRDSIMAVNGSLDLRPGGPATRDIASRRRTLYLMTIRSIRNDYRSLFDAPDANSIVDKRVISTVAPQALFLLNNPFILTETRRLAERVLNESPRDDGRRVSWLYEHLFSRSPSSIEIEIARQALERVYATMNGSFSEKEIAAWEAFSQILLASNEFAFID